MEKFAADLLRWRDYVAPRAPGYRRIAELIAEQDAAAFEGAWRGREFRAWFDRPLLILASLRADALASRDEHPLRRALAGDGSAEEVDRERVIAALDPSRAIFWRTVAERHVQTNETSRAVAWLWPAHAAGCSDGARPLALFDLGASAGLNLVADALPPIWVDPYGAPLPVVRAPRALVRMGFDARPVDVTSDDDVAWLRACIWAGEEERLARFEAAVNAARSMRVPVEKCDLGDAPARIEELVRALSEDTLVLAYQTHVRDYLAPETRARLESGLRALIARRPHTIWSALEPSEADLAHPASLVVNGVEWARMGHHPRDVQVMG